YPLAERMGTTGRVGEVGDARDEAAQGTGLDGGCYVRRLLASPAWRQSGEAGLGENLAQLDTPGSQLIPNSRTVQALGQHQGSPASLTGASRVGEGRL
ncbi:MAG: hypothetical protein ACRDAP_07595, partial [Shewanella sp.]